MAAKPAERMDVDARLTRVEANLQHLGSRFDAFLDEHRSQAKAIEVSISQLRTPFASMAGWAGVVVTLGLAGIAASYSILNDKVKTVEALTAAQVDSLRGVVSLNTERHAQMRSELTQLRGEVNTREAEIRTQLSEVEMQFRTGGQIYNAVDYRHDMLIDQLWRRVFGTAIREDTPWPVLGREK